MIELCGVAKSFGAQVAVRVTDLRAEAAATTVLIGPSGCGKSTLLRLMNGLLLPDEGRVLLGGEALDPATLDLTRRRIGYVIQDGGLFPHLTARGNVLLMARYLGWDEERCAARVRELTTLTHFPIDGLGRFPAELSGGQVQRVALMRALMLEPEVLLLDEPMAALDPMIRAELQADLLEIFDRLGTTVVMVTHDLSEAIHFADTMVLMREGAVVQRGTVADLVHSPASAFVEEFMRAQRPAAWPERGPS